MSNKSVDFIKTSNEIQLKQQKEEADYISYDAPPLDFSFKNIKHISQLKDVQPRQGQKKHHQANEDNKKKLNKDQKEDNDQATDNDEHRQDKKKNQAMKLLPNNNINSVVAQMVNTSAMKNISLKAKEELEKKKKKAIHVKLVCSSLLLSYNKIKQLTGLNKVLSGIMDNLNDLQWIDLSHNHLVDLDYGFEEIPHLKTLYLHCNFLFDFNTLEKLKLLKELKNMTIHGNPLTSVPNFRILTISILTQLKKLDSVLISKKQKDNAVFIRSQTKKYPLPKNPLKPPVEKKEEDEQQKQ